jgi:hypothetical protein
MKKRGAILAILVSLISISLQPMATTAAVYNPPVPGNVIMRLVSPEPTSRNSVNTTAEAKGTWDQFYGKGLRSLHMFADVRGDVSLTFKYTNKDGVPFQNRVVYLVVNKRASCSETTFFTPQATNYPGFNRPNSNTIVRDWCGDQPQMGAGETAILATTDSFGNATFSMTNYNIMGEAFPVAQNKLSFYSDGIPCSDDVMCVSSTIAPSMVAHPSEAQDRLEDKDLLVLHFVNPKITPLRKEVKATAGKAVDVSFKLTNLKGKPVAGKTVTFDTWGEGDDLDTWSRISNARGIVTIKVNAPKGTKGLQVLKAYNYGNPKGYKAKIYWQ